jgi:polysaccharide export outer membrane protein
MPLRTESAMTYQLWVIARGPQGLMLHGLAYACLLLAPNGSSSAQNDGFPQAVNVRLQAAAENSDIERLPAIAAETPTHSRTSERVALREPPADSASPTLDVPHQAPAEDPSLFDHPSDAIGEDDAAADVEALPPGEFVVAPPGNMPYVFSQPACPVCGVHCGNGCCQPHATWQSSTLIPWEVFAQGEYIGPERLVHVPEYILRVDDKIDFVYRITAEPSRTPYEFNVGDSFRIESLTEDDLDREVTVQPDGNVTVPLLGQVRAAGRTIEAIRADLEEQYKKHIKEPSLTLTPLVMNTRLNELRATVDSRFGIGGQTLTTRITPEGTVQLPALGSVPAHGLSLTQLRHEVNSRYAKTIYGIDVTPVLVERAPRYVFVLGAVAVPGRYEMSGPTTVMQSLAMAGGYRVGSGLKQVVVFRRDENWQLMATRVDMNHLRWGNQPCPAGELWVRDADVIMVPQRPMENANQIIEHLFTRGLYSVFPVDFSVNFSRLSTI